jgi:hypothetical protein
MEQSSSMNKQQEAMYNFMNSNVTSQNKKSGVNNQGMSGLRLGMDPFDDNSGQFGDKSYQKSSRLFYVFYLIYV